MSFRPWLNTMPKIDNAIQIGRGVAAAVVGQEFDVYRLTPGVSTGSIYDQAPLFVNFPCPAQKAGKAAPRTRFSTSTSSRRP